MSRISWTREELQGHALVWLVDVEFGGVVRRIATRTIVVESTNGTLVYEGTAEDIVWSRSIELFSLQPEPESIVVEGMLPCDVAQLVAQGHSLEGAPVQVSQVRIRKGPTAGACEAVDAYEARRACLSGRAVDAEWGVAGDQGSFVRFAASRNTFDSTTQVPLAHQRVNDETWKTTGRVGDADLDVYYPIPIGYPGRDDTAPDGWISGTIGVWLNKQLGYNILCLGLAPVEAATVWLNTDDDVTGQEVNVRYEYSNALGTYESRDKKGTLLAVVDYQTDGYDSGAGNELPVSYRPSVDSTDQVFVGWPAGSGGFMWQGEVLREAGDVLWWAMEQAGIPVDVAAFRAARPALAWAKFDTVIDDAVNPVEWATDAVLPLLPVSLMITENGVAPWVWNPNATKHDAVCHFDFDADPTLDPADTVKADATNIANTFELKYAYSQRAERFTHTARLGPKRIESTAAAKHRLILTRAAAAPARVSLYARETGQAGDGITVVCTVSASPLSVTDTPATRTVTVNLEIATSGTPTSAPDLVAAINDPSTGSALIEAETSEEGTDGYLDTDTPSVVLRLPDFGTAGNLRCARSVLQCAKGDKPGPNAGVRLKRLESVHLCDHATAARALEWQAAAYAEPQRRLETLAPEEDYGWLNPGADITASWDDQHLDELVGVIEGMDMYSDGTVGFRFVFLGASAGA